MRRNRFRGSGAGDAGERDQAREAACLGCSAREADEEDLVSRLVILTQEAIAALDAAADAEAHRADREAPLAQRRLGGDADLVVGHLRDPAGVGRQNDALQLDDVGLLGVLGLVPGAVEKAQQPLHLTDPP